MLDKKINRRGRRGLWTVVDGLDGVGKGVVERAITEYEQKLGKAIFDTISFSKANRRGLPELKDFWNPPETYYDTIITSEPTYSGVGHNIRFEMIANNGRRYSARSQVQAYDLDRLIQMKRVVFPALDSGLNALQSRCCAASMTYQSLVAEDEGKNPERFRDYILRQEGNALQLQNAPDLLIIPIVRDTKRLLERLSERKNTKKDDNAIFEEVKFQERLNPLYQSDWLRELFETRGTKVEYLDADISEDETRSQAIEIYRKFLVNKS